MNIEVLKLNKLYGEHKIVDIEELIIPKGSLFGIIGPNGAGKSTLAKIIAGIEEATYGEILYDKQQLQEKHYKRMTMVFQKPYLLRSTIYENIAYPLKLRNMANAEIEIRVNKILKEMDLEKIKDRKAWVLSGGESQKVALARALVFKPELLILDEPTANIDPSSIAVMEKMIRKVNQEDHTTVLIITHNLAQAKRLCKEVAFLYKGQMLEAGLVKEVISQPKNPIIKAFIQEELY